MKPLHWFIPNFDWGTSLGNVRSLSSVWKFRSLGKAGFLKLILSKKSIWNQGTNARKVISEAYAFLYWSVLSLGSNVNTRRLTQPAIWSIFHIKNQIWKMKNEIFWSLFWSLLCELSKLSKFNAFNLLGY